MLCAWKRYGAPIFDTVRGGCPIFQRIGVINRKPAGASLFLEEQ
jgi:hypothetical protein